MSNIIRSIALVSVIGVICTMTYLSSTNTQSVEAAPKEQKILRHVVMFKFKESATPEDIKRVEEAFSGLPKKISAIKDYEFGINNSPEKHDKGFTHCFLLTFDSEAGRDEYLPHPAHKEFGNVLRPHLEDVHVLDYWAQD